MANTIADKLTYLSGTKDAIKQAIIGKGVEVTDTDTFRSYADKITSIQTGGGGTANIPDGTKFGYSTFTTVSDSIIPYLEQQTNLYEMFRDCSNLTTVPLFDTSKCTNFEYMFWGCNNLTTVPLFDLSKATNVNGMFCQCNNLTTVPLFDLSKATDIGYFLNSTKITSVPNFQINPDLKNITDVFEGCTELIEVPDIFSNTKIDNASSAFENCTKLETIGTLSFYEGSYYINSVSWIFRNCSNLKNIGGMTNLKSSLDLSDSPLLTVDSVMNIINTVKKMSSSKTQTLTLYQDVFNKLSEEQIATASAKGWNIAAA